MDGLRWLLLVIGLLVIAGVYLYSHRVSASGKERGVEHARREPTLISESSTDTEFETDLEVDISTETSVGLENESLLIADGDESPITSADSPETVSLPQKIVALRIIARGGGAFPGDDLILNLRGIGMRHGKFGIFHRLDGTDDGEAIFSAASLIEPGSFDLANIRDQEIPGISLFAVLPGPIGSLEAFDMLMAAARTLAQSLDAELLDESGSTLSIQRERYMREEVVQYQHSHKVA